MNNEENQQTTITEDKINEKTIKNNKKKHIIILLGIFVVISIMIIITICSNNGYFLSQEEKTSKVLEVLATKNYDKAEELLNKYFESGKEKNKLLATIENYEQLSVGTQSEYEDKLESIRLDMLNAQLNNLNSIEITKQDNSVDGNYIYTKTTIKNNNTRALKYIKINIYLCGDESMNNIVDSVWTNSDSRLPSGGSMVIDKMIPYNPNGKFIKAEVAEVVFE